MTAVTNEGEMAAVAAGLAAPTGDVPGREWSLAIAEQVNDRVAAWLDAREASEVLLAMTGVLAGKVEQHREEAALVGRRALAVITAALERADPEETRGLAGEMREAWDGFMGAAMLWAQPPKAGRTARQRDDRERTR